MEMEDNLPAVDIVEQNVKVSRKKKKPGIVYLSTLPPFMNVTKIRDIFNCYGEVGRVFLQPATSETKTKSKKKKPAVHFSEGWIEFLSKRAAKAVAEKLNNTQIGGKKRSKFYDYIWNVKYLPRFKWAHLGERLAYERAVHKQRLRAEIAQAKREANFFSASIEKRRKRKIIGEGLSNEVRLKPPKEDDGPAGSGDRTEFLKTLFT